jgi:hypothetical protein
MAVVQRPSTSDNLTLSSNVNVNLIANQMHPDWVRWCYSSINKFFDTKKSSYDLYIEGDIRTQQDEAEFAELRIDGPFISNPQKGLYYLDVEINILCQTHLDPRRFYTAQVMVGTFTSAFTNQIPVYKYGDGPLDDNSLLGCFHLIGRNQGVDVGYFGIVRSDTKIVQTTVEGHYRLELGL